MFYFLFYTVICSLKQTVSVSSLKHLNICECLGHHVVEDMGITEFDENQHIFSSTIFLLITYSLSESLEQSVVPEISRILMRPDNIDLHQYV